MNKKILEKIKADREILDTLPINNDKNIQIFNKKVDELQEEYINLNNQVLSEIEKRFKAKTVLEDNSEIDKLKGELSNYEEIIEVLNEIKTPYQKSELNKETYRLGKYYKENLENVNNQILICVNIFRNLGIDVSASDFNISEYARTYMEVFFTEMKTGDVNTETIKSKFEEIYWKCPDLITHIEVNIKNIYMNNLSTITKFYEKKKENILSKYKLSKEEVIEQYYVTKKELIRLELINKNNILNRFLSGDLNTKDYTEDKVSTYYEKILNPDLLKEVKEHPEKIEEIDLNILKFKNSVFEYKKFMEYKFIIDEVLDKYKEKDKYKTLYKENLKQIKSKENKLKKLNQRGLFGKKKNNMTEANKIINELKTDYKDYGRDLFYNRIVNDINGATSLYTILNLADSFYEFLVDCFIAKYSEIEQVEIDTKINELTGFIRFPYFTILNNIYIEENKDLALIIKDRYKLLNFNIEKEDLDESNIDNLLNLLEKIRINYAIKKSGLNIEEIENICKYKKIIEENNK